MQVSSTSAFLMDERRFQDAPSSLTSTPSDSGHRAHGDAQGNGLDDAPETPVTRSHDISARFGLRLRELRRERNLTQLRMATEFGIDRSFISDVERGRKSISLPMLEIIALGMKLSLSDLLRDL